MRNDDIALPSLAPTAPLAPDLEKYRALLGDIEVTEEQANALLLEIWTFMLKCVEAQFTLPSIPDIFAVLLQESSELCADELDSSREQHCEVLACAGSDDARE